MTDPAAPIRVLAVDDHPVLLDGLSALIGSQPDMRLVGASSTGAAGIAEFRIHRPDVTLMDLRLPDMSGIEAIETIRAEHAHARIIILTTFPGDVQAIRALQAGASGYLLKATLRTDLLDAIRAVHRGRRQVPADVASEMAQHATDEALTPRELDVLSLVSNGNSNKRVAHSLNVSEDTVKSHMRNILAKLHANDRAHAVTIALRRGFLDL